MSWSDIVVTAVSLWHFHALVSWRGRVRVSLELDSRDDRDDQE